MKKDSRRATTNESVSRSHRVDELHSVNTRVEKLPTSEGLGRRNSDERRVRTVKRHGFLEALRKHMSAAAYAEAGEYDAARDLITSSKRNTSILLLIEGTTPAPSTIDYALNLCRRTSSSLDVLQVIEMSNDPDYYARLCSALSRVSQNIVELMKKVDHGKVPVKITIRLGDVNQKLVNYAKRHSEISMVIFDSPKIRGASEGDRTRKRMIQNLAQRLSVPLITVDSRELVYAPLTV